jgi:hypothetical protein
MSRSVARSATDEDHDLLAGYARFAAGLGLSDGGLRERLFHTYQTELTNAGVSVQGLVVLVTHMTLEMAPRCVTLARPILRAVHDPVVAALAGPPYLWRLPRARAARWLITPRARRGWPRTSAPSASRLALAAAEQRARQRPAACLVSQGHRPVRPHCGQPEPPLPEDPRLEQSRRSPRCTPQAPARVATLTRTRQSPTAAPHLTAIAGQPVQRRAVRQVTCWGRSGRAVWTEWQLLAEWEPVTAVGAVDLWPRRRRLALSARLPE